MKTHSLRVLAGALLASLLLSSLVACGGNTNDGNGTDPVTTTEQATTVAPEPAGPVKLDGTPIELTAEFSIVSADKDNDAALMMLNDIKKKISAKTGITIALGRAGTVKECEIVLGYSDDRAACKPTYESIDSEDYTVYVDGSTVVLGAWNNDTLKNAVDLFLDTALVQEDGKWMIYPYLMTEETSMPVGVDLSQYRIVYAADAGSYLKKTVVPYLQHCLRTTFGVTVSAVTDSEAVGEYEIVVGETNRTTDAVRAHLGDGDRVDYLSYVIASEGKNIHLYAKSEVALYSACEYLCDSSVPQIGPKLFCLSAEVKFSPKIDTKDKAELAEGADIRVMSYNILHPNWSNVTTTVPVDGRDVNMAKILMYYMPDVVGLQEVNSDWHRSIKKLLIDTEIYKPACQKKRNGSDYNLTTFLYNPRTVKLIDEYVLDLDANSNIRVLSVAVFEKLSDGTRFVVTNTHPAPGSQAANYKRNFADMMTLMGKELQKYKDLPFIMTGDFNTKEQDSMYKTFMDTVGVADAKYDAETLVRDYSTFLSPAWGGSIIKGNRSCIDHIFINSKADAKLFNVVIDHKVEKTSDHIPIYADIDLK